MSNLGSVSVSSNWDSFSNDLFNIFISFIAENFILINSSVTVTLKKKETTTFDKTIKIFSRKKEKNTHLLPSQSTFDL